MPVVVGVCFPHDIECRTNCRRRPAHYYRGGDADLYVAVTRESVQTGKDAADHDPAACQSWQQMAAKLDTPDGQALYKQRKAIIEPVFAQLFARFGPGTRIAAARTDAAPDNPARKTR